MGFDVISLGILVVDALGKPIDAVPEEGKLALFERMELHIGGCAANTGIALSILGARVKVIGKVGRDPFGDFVIDTLRRSGVDAGGVRRDPEVSTAFTFAMISSKGGRRFLHCLGADATFSIDDVDLRAVEEGRILHVAGTTLMPKFDGEQTAELLRYAKRAGLITTLDTAYNDRLDDWEGVIYPCLPYLDYFLPSVEEAERVTGEADPHRMAKILKEECPGVVGIKLGPEGFLYRTDSVEKVIPPYKVEVVDTSGAGDCFIAGFLKGILEGWDVERCAKFGSAVASFCIRAIGCTAGVRPMEEVLRFMESQERKGIAA